MIFIIAALLKIPESVGRQLRLMNGALVIMPFVQIELGYEERQTAHAAAWHAPNRDLLFGLSWAISMIASLVSAE